MSNFEFSLAPIVLFVYNRPEHTLKTLTALKNNKYADSSSLYIYCDGPKKGSDVVCTQNISQVRKIVKSDKWCKDVYIIESEINIGLANSIKKGVTEIVNQFGKVIVLEDDIVTSPAFLGYMNKALAYYENKKSVFSVSGYNYPSAMINIPADYEYDVFVSVRNSSWGWGTWADRWKLIDWECENYKVVLNSKEIQNAFNRGGDDVYELLRMQQSGELKIWSIQATLAQFENHLVTIFPKVSYVDNVGLDGSGENCSISINLRNKTINTNEDIRFLDVLYEDKRIINTFYNVNCQKKRPLWQKLINRMSRLTGHKNIFVIKKKIYQ
ncbi:MAG: glycosyl transferase [Paludibacteraceae bacterium]|nr:glycosyl transferase [Paludibacteraceae bacterium]